MIVLELFGLTDLPTGKLRGAKTVRWVKDYLLECFVKQQGFKLNNNGTLEEYRKSLTSDTSIVWCGQARCERCVELRILCIQEPNKSLCADIENATVLENTVRATSGAWIRQWVGQTSYSYWPDRRAEVAELDRVRKEAVEVIPPRFDQSRADLLEAQIRQAWVEECTTVLGRGCPREGFTRGLNELKTWGSKYNGKAGAAWREVFLVMKKVSWDNERMLELIESQSSWEAARTRAMLEGKANNEIEGLRKVISNQEIEIMKMRDEIGQRDGTTTVESPVLAELRQTISEELAELRRETDELRELRLNGTATTVELRQLHQASIAQTRQHEAAVSTLNKEILELRDELQRKEIRLQELSDLQAIEIGCDHQAVSRKRKHDLALQLEAEKRRACDFDRKGKQSLARAAELHVRILDIEADLDSRDESVVEGLRKEVAGLRETLAKQSPGEDLAQQSTSLSIDEADLIRARRHALKAALSLGVVTPRQVPDDEKEVDDGPDERLDDPNEDMQVEPDGEGDNARAGKRQRTD
jgi:hypothetical protein